jgi:hypothetical protein
MDGDADLTPPKWRARYAQGPEEFAAALAGLTESDLDVSIAEGEWTIREIINHVAEVEVRATFMMTVAIGNSGAPFALDWFPGLNKTWGHALAFDARPVGPSLATIRQVRAYFLAQMDAIPDAGGRYIMVSGGEIGSEPLRRTVDELVQGYSAHITEHIAEIGKIRALRGI